MGNASELFSRFSLYSFPKGQRVGTRTRKWRCDETDDQVTLITHDEKLGFNPSDETRPFREARKWHLELYWRQM